MKISDLVNKYEANRKHYISPTYNETQLRRDFLDPFFQLLGWDIENKLNKSTNEREVLLEESIRNNADSTSKKPDYTFRLYSERKFFLEAKKPSIKIDINTDSALQIRRYGFTAKMKISLLSNFENLIIYDCSQKVMEKDQANKARIKIYHYTEYADRFSEINSFIGKDSVYSGEFDKNWEHIEEQLSLFGVDKLFLNQINKWRLLLGEEIYSAKPDIKDETLNDVVQSYLNSIIFLRVCEDRNLEVYETLLKFATQEDFNLLLDKFVEADKKYNSGLFNNEFEKELIQNSSTSFWEIIRELYYPQSTYSFSVFSSDILGHIYEIFLSEKLSIKENHITLIKKPDNLERDVVTTPSFVIKDLLRSTLVPFFENKSTSQIFDSKVADIACGSGSFLLEVFQLINDILIDLFIEHTPEQLIQTNINTFKLPYKIKREILTRCIFGVDKDYNAVEACKFGLLLKLLEDEDNSTITTPALPDLTQNIQFGNSLLETNEIRNASINEINPFDFGDKKFDIIVGNPPYMATEHIRKLTPLELPLYKTNYNTAYKQFDKYFLFIEKGYNLLSENGMLGFIIPSKFIKVGAAKRLRQFLKRNKCISKIVSFGANQIFEDKTTYTCLLTLSKSKIEEIDYYEVYSLKNWKTRNIQEDVFNKINLGELNDEFWVLLPKKLKNVFSQITNNSINLSSLVGSENIYNGIQTSANDIYIHLKSKKDENYFYFRKDGKEWKVERETTRPYFQTSSGDSNLYTYRLLVPNAFVIYPYKKTDKGIQLIEINELKKKHPFTYNYLSEYKMTLVKRDIRPIPKTKDEWYRYGRHQCLENCDVPLKIIVGILSLGNKYAIDVNHTFISSGGTAGYCMITLPSDIEYSIYYIQALLNSKYLEWYSSIIGEIFRGGFIARGTKVLKRLPIKKIDFKNINEKKLHDDIATIQEKLILLQSEIDKNKSNKRQLILLNRSFDNYKNILDIKLRELYNLGEEDELVPIISEIYGTD